MAGLYDGVEEIGFHRVSGGYLFQPANSWPFGPRPCYFVNEEQKRAIAACIRETLRRMKPFAYAAAVVIPILLVGGTLLLALSGNVTRVIIIDAQGAQSHHSEMMESSGADGEVQGASGTKIVFHVSGPPGDGARALRAAGAGRGFPAPRRGRGRLTRPGLAFEAAPA